MADEVIQAVFKFKNDSESPAFQQKHSKKWKTGRRRGQKRNQSSIKKRMGKKNRGRKNKTIKRRKGRILHKLKPITIRQIIEMVAQEALTKTSGSYNYNQLEAEILGNGFQASRVSSTESSVKLQIGG